MLLDHPISMGAQDISPEEAKKVLTTGQWGNDPALRLVVGDAKRAEDYEMSKQWVLQWPQAMSLYQSPYSPRYWEGTQTERANIPFFTVANAVNSLTPQIMNGLFYDEPPFMLSPRPGTREQATRAMSAVIGYQLEDICFREELRLGINNVALFGTGIWKWGWETFERERTRYERKKPTLTIPNMMGNVDMGNIQVYNDEIEEVVKKETIDRPVFENITDLTQVLVDPTLNVPDIRKAKYVIHRVYMTWDDLDKLRDRPGYKIPSKAKMLEMFFPPAEIAIENIGEAGTNPMGSLESEAQYETGTEDPFAKPLEVLERWDNGKCIVVLQQKLVICNDSNPYGKIPFLSVNWWDVPKAFYGLGLARLIGAEQRLQQGITNVWLDQAALALNGVYTRVKGAGVPTQAIRIAPGRVIDVTSEKELMPLPRPAAVPEAGEHLSLSTARAEQIGGANSASTQGIAGSTGHSNLARSSAGAQLIGAGSGSRTADFVDKLVAQVFIPFLNEVMDMNQSMMPMQMLRTILSTELQHEFMREASNDLVELLNVRARIQIAAGAKLQARRAMAQALPLLTQYLQQTTTQEQLALQGLKIDVAEIIRMFFEVSDWKNVNDVLIPMTDEDKQRLAAMQSGAGINAKIQAQTQLVQQKFENAQKLSDQENIARAGREVLRQALEKSATPMALTGEPGNVGFGSQV